MGEFPLGSMLLAGAIAAAAGFLPAPARAAECLENNVHGTSAPGRLGISEYLATLSFDACPTDGLKKDISVWPRQQIYVWLRLEGDRQFADHASAAKRFEIQVHRTDALKGDIRKLALDNDRLGIDGIRNEASLPENNGYFDWRLYARINTFLVPGTYELMVWYGNSRVCLVDGRCAITFNIKRRS